MRFADRRPGKTHKNENFPVASLLLAPQHRQPILAFYNFARLADDIADSPALTPKAKLERLDRLEAGLDGTTTQDAVSVALKATLAARGLSDEHPRALLKAFRQDITVKRYLNWRELMDYCANSAMPVGRFVLDLHGEARTTWRASDNICAALQVINHLQDCGQDYQQLNRVYIPISLLVKNAASVEDLGARQASDRIRAAITTLAAQAGQLLDVGEHLSAQVKDARLAREIAVIIALARNNVKKLRVEDPLQGGGRTGKAEALYIAFATLLREQRQRATTPSERNADDVGV